MSALTIWFMDQARKRRRRNPIEENEFLDIILRENKRYKIEENRTILYKSYPGSDYRAIDIARQIQEDLLDPGWEVYWVKNHIFPIEGELHAKKAGGLTLHTNKKIFILFGNVPENYNSLHTLLHELYHSIHGIYPHHYEEVELEAELFAIKKSKRYDIPQTHINRLITDAISYGVFHFVSHKGKELTSKWKFLQGLVIGASTIPLHNWYEMYLRGKIVIDQKVIKKYMDLING